MDATGFAGATGRGRIAALVGTITRVRHRREGRLNRVLWAVPIEAR